MDFIFVFIVYFYATATLFLVLKKVVIGFVARPLQFNYLFNVPLFFQKSGYDFPEFPEFFQKLYYVCLFIVDPLEQTIKLERPHVILGICNILELCGVKDQLDHVIVYHSLMPKRHI
uniref:Uncharacterized protein n=1 Tax=Rhizophagus irregularis (strain DAOM 181602 / DAOM 197198 / MUCL 43194) TaxID=747089 RepID=U9UKS2_RHIID